MYNPKVGDKYYDGCNTHVYRGNGIWDSTMLFCPPIDISIPSGWKKVNSKDDDKPSRLQKKPTK